MIFKKYFFRVVLVTLFLVLVFGLSLFVKIYNYVGIDNATRSDAIVVLGASQWGGEPSPVFKARLDHAFFLYESGLAEKIILTGGVGKGENIAESVVGKKYLTGKSISEKNILTEANGKTSLQSLREVKNILQKQNLNSVILVSDGFHMARLEKMTKDLKMNATVSPTKNSPISESSELKYMFREVYVYILYLLFKV